MQTEEQNKRGMIITDDFAKNPVLDFNAYADTIVEIIKGSDPNFTIGIYGEWGTGKTTLMRKIELKLKSEKSITTVWFNAWRYEREEQFTLIPLLKKIAYSLPAADEFNGLRDSIKKGVEKIIFGQSFGGVTDLTVGPDGYLYVVSIGQGKVFRILPK